MRFCLLTVMKHNINKKKHLFLGLYIEGLAFPFFSSLSSKQWTQYRNIWVWQQLLSAKQYELYSSNPKGEKTENELWASQLQLCREECQVTLSSPWNSSRNSVKLPCLYHEQTLKVAWTPPTESLLSAAYDYFSLKSSLPVRGLYRTFHPMQLFHSKVVKLSRFKIFYVIIPETCNAHMFLEEQFDKEVAFCYK